MKNPRPTRAEVTDVANAIYDGTGAIMLSGETAAGLYPVEAVTMMARIAERTENDIDYRKRFFVRTRKANPDITDAICHATCTTAYDLNARDIVTVTKSGRSARMVARYRPSCGIIGCTPTKKVWYQLNLAWGVTPVLLSETDDVFDLFDSALETAKNQGLMQSGDLAVITSGVPIGVSGTTNMILKGEELYYLELLSGKFDACGTESVFTCCFRMLRTLFRRSHRRSARVFSC